MSPAQHTGHRPTRSQQLLLRALIPARHRDEVIVVHHVWDTPLHLTVQVERRAPWGVTFERVVL